MTRSRNPSLWYLPVWSSGAAPMWWSVSAAGSWLARGSLSKPYGKTNKQTKSHFSIFSTTNKRWKMPEWIKVEGQASLQVGTLTAAGLWGLMHDTHLDSSRFWGSAGNACTVFRPTQLPRSLCLWLCKLCPCSAPSPCICSISYR